MQSENKKHGLDQLALPACCIYVSRKPVAGRYILNKRRRAAPIFGNRASMKNTAVVYPAGGPDAEAGVPPCVDAPCWMMPREGPRPRGPCPRMGDSHDECAREDGSLVPLRLKGYTQQALAAFGQPTDGKCSTPAPFHFMGIPKRRRKEHAKWKTNGHSPAAPSRRSGF